MPGFELCEKLTRKPNFSIFHVFQVLTDAFLFIGASGDVPQLLILSVISNSHDSTLLVTNLFRFTSVPLYFDGDRILAHSAYRGSKTTSG
jgi:hypothetical protein